MGIFKKAFLREDGSLTWSKVGGWLASLSVAIVTVSVLPLESIQIPAAVKDLGMIAGTLGAMLGGGAAVAGFRDKK